MDRATLVSLARLGSCEWSALAALVLEGQGESSFVPARRGTNDPAAIGRLLCQIANLPTEGLDGKPLAARRLELLSAFLPPRGKIKLIEQQCNGESIGQPTTTTFTRADATGEELDDRFHALIERDAAGAPGVFVCSGVGRGYAVDVTLLAGAQGQLYIQSIDYQRIVGCD